MGTAAVSAGAAGPFEGLRAGRSSGRTQAGVHRGERTTRPRDLRERADASVRRPGLGARLLATSDEARAGWYIADYSAFLFRAQVTEYWLATKLV